jgi:hypothetical protein
MSRAIVSVATGRYTRGLDRLTEWCAANGEDYITWRDKLPPRSPTHQEIPYAFKSFALKAAADGADTLLWCDASIIPIRPLAPLWERIERDGYWIANNGWSNYEWTADSAYPALFPQWENNISDGCDRYASAKTANRDIKHVVAGCFGLSMAHPLGKAIFDEYYRLASTTKAFCGPWTNARYALGPDEQFPPTNLRCEPCGPPDVRGHRHDQTALSVIAWRLGCKLTNCPYILDYKSDRHDPGTIILMDGIC